ncbi:MAG TPA: serine/threonine-protein kinase [Actinophytocola sp.]|uniref:serine/threonine-protein kinase n=1 Tax=Actinophytocola sp. TaxID=1872138 RepID=UPI002DDDAA10|nr:serine/threonine-protein kinase [Actinophytocola sp.]HEV2777988.1 serine/threonine-protein kinase [Actinophytocola sp.]
MEDEDRLVAGRYRLAERIGAGGMGVVWRAYDERLHRQVAVKQILPPAELTGPQTVQAKRRAMREGRNAARLQHPHAVAVYDVVEDGDQSYLIMEYVPSRSLAQVLGERGTLPVPEAARIGAQLAAALDTAHAAGVVHRDVKPGNVLLGPDGTAKLTDFGISRAVEDVTATGSGLIAGTPAYLSPEVAQGRRAGYLSDVYSLGATMYAAIEGSPPAGSTDNAMAMLHRVASGNLVPPSHAGPMTDLLTRMLSADPDGRPAMAEVRDQLVTLAHQPTPTATRPLESPPAEDTAPDTAPVGASVPAHASRRSRVRALIATAVVLAAIAAVVLTTVLNRPDPTGGTAQPAGTSPAEPRTTTPTQPSPPTSTAPVTTTTTRAPAPTTITQPPGPPGPPSTPTSTIIDYYALMPADLPTAWTWLTPRYQQHPAGGYGGYQTFWANVRSVRVSDVNGVSDNGVEATVEYAFKDGRTVLERHRYTLVMQGRWKIDQSVVLSSRTL